MSYLEGTHGLVALVLLCVLLFAEETGVPIPFAPGEICLVAGGLLIATGNLDAYLFVPLAIVSCLAGSLVGYSWANFVGERGLTAAAGRLRQERRLDRVAERVRAAGPLQVGVTRLIPGLRIYTSLVAGAASVPRRAFLGGVVPATVLWVLFFTVLGGVVGIPVERFLTSIARLVFEGTLLLVIGLGTYLAARWVPGHRSSALGRLPTPLRMVLAILMDVAVVVTLIAGLEWFLRRVLGIAIFSVGLSLALVTAGTIIAYLVIARRGLGATAGEALLGITYRQNPLDRRPADGGAQVPHGVRAASRRFRVLGDERRLQLLGLLLDDDRTADDLARLLGLPLGDVLGHLGRLERAGLVRSEGDDSGRRYRVSGSSVGEAVAHLLEEPPDDPGPHEDGVE
ncbi:MAG: VTT domain-containing protein [Candidatus Dormibacteraeota bacterium]|nr:VTT domain-containing protein [Candidatus Dormibacteraeota bacterium]